jgi:hypothetical protein
MIKIKNIGQELTEMGEISPKSQTSVNIWPIWPRYDQNQKHRSKYDRNGRDIAEITNIGQYLTEIQNIGDVMINLTSAPHYSHTPQHPKHRPFWESPQYQLFPHSSHLTAASPLHHNRSPFIYK